MSERPYPRCLTFHQEELLPLSVVIGVLEQELAGYVKLAAEDADDRPVSVASIAANVSEALETAFDAVAS